MLANKAILMCLPYVSLYSPCEIKLINLNKLFSLTTLFLNHFYDFQFYV